jgi:spore maturation protein SpmA
MLQPPPGFPGAGGAGAMNAPPGFGGGAGMPGGMNAMQDVSQFDSQINSMMNNNLMFLAVQTKVQNVSQTTQLMSNIFKADSDAKLNAIRNVRS